jgi:hypothetical protein
MIESRLQDYPFKTVRLICSKCELQARFNRDKLIAEHGADAAMLDLRSRLATCVFRHAAGTSCGAFFPDLIVG